LRLHLLQKQVAATLDVNIETLKNWERGVGAPLNRHVPRIIQFLGFDPEPKPQRIRERIVYVRRRLGLTQEDLAERLAVDPVTVYRWEKGFSVPSAQMLQLIDTFRSPAKAVTRR
jgi:DNA-binding transcriptional regulator YiaG